MVLLPHIDPRLNALKVVVNLVEVVAVQLNNHLLVVRVAGFLQQDLHDFGVHVLVQLLVGVAAGLQAVVENGAVAADDDNKVNHRGGKEVASVPVDDLTAGLEVGFDGVQELLRVRRMSLVALCTRGCNVPCLRQQ